MKILEKLSLLFRLLSSRGVGHTELLKRGTIAYDIFKDPVTDDGTKKSLKGLIAVEEITHMDESGKLYTKYEVHTQCTVEEEQTGILRTIYENGKFYNQTSLTEIRNKLNNLI